MKLGKKRNPGSRSDRSDRPLRYGPMARTSDWLCAGRDGRAGLPEVVQPAIPPSPEAGGENAAPWTTPRTVFLGQLGRGRAEAEWLLYQKDVAESQVRLTRVRANRGTAARDLAAAEQRLADLAEPTEEELRTRTSGEERTDGSVLVARRRRDHTDRRVRLEQEVARIRGTLTECDIEIAELRERIRVRFERARTGADLIGAYVQRRCAAYLTRLVRKHPEGKQVGALVRSGWHDRPRWSTWDSPPELADPAGGA
ncbi:hypothetical protein [Amycolatopsis sp. NBC_00438]|uniref:hypothetical protein n=1 Tax=Amycolatopsis sp. NBC_00438 TaxID=2903558 RepID=UPI002E1DE70A